MQASDERDITVPGRPPAHSDHVQEVLAGTKDYYARHPVVAPVAEIKPVREGRDVVGKLAVEHVLNTLGLDEAAARRILNMMTEAELAKLRESVQKLSVALRSMEPDPMPVFVIKGKDKLAPRAVDAYAQLCDTLGLDEQRREVELAAEEIRGWQQRHRDLVKLPDHPHVPAAGPVERESESGR